jgi:hypothetical protein
MKFFIVSEKIVFYILANILVKFSYNHIRLFIYFQVPVLQIRTT